MALQGKPVAIGNTATTIYTCPGGTEAAVHGLIFANNTGGALTVDLAFYDQTTGTTVTVATDLSVSANSYITWSKPINMNAGDYIQATSSAASGLVCLFSAYEGSAAPVAIGFTARGVWSSASTYAINDIVTVVGTGTYLAIQASTNQNPTSATAYWMFLEGISASALPSQAGQAGKYLTTDGTDASWATLDVSGGGTVTNPMSANVTLTSSSTRIQVFYPNTVGYTVTLPATSSLTEGDSFVIVNKSPSFSINVLNNSGSIIVVLPAAKVVKMFLADIATSDWEATLTDSAPLMAVDYQLQYFSTNNTQAVTLQKRGTNSYRALFAEQETVASFKDFTLTSAGVFTETATGNVSVGNYTYGENANAFVEIDTNIYAFSGYSSAAGYYLRARILEISGSTLSLRYNAEVITNTTEYYANICVKAATRKFVAFGAAYWGSSAEAGPRAIVIDASSSLTSPTLGSSTLLNTGSTRSPYCISACTLDTDKGIVLTGSKVTSNGTVDIVPKVAVWTTSGTTISFGTVYNLDSLGGYYSSASPSYRQAVVPISTTEAVAVWYSSNGNLYFRDITVSGTNITFGTQYAIGTLPPAAINVTRATASLYIVTVQNLLDGSKPYIIGVNKTGSVYSLLFLAAAGEFVKDGKSTSPFIYDSEKNSLVGSVHTNSAGYVTNAVLSSI